MRSYLGKLCSDGTLAHYTIVDSAGLVGRCIKPNCGLVVDFAEMKKDKKKRIMIYAEKKRPRRKKLGRPSKLRKGVKYGQNRERETKAEIHTGESLGRG